MKLNHRKLVVVACISSFTVLMMVYLQGCYYHDINSDVNELTDEALQGGRNGTINLQSDVAFAQPIPPMLTADVINFKVGRSFFHTSWITAPASTTAVDGLGPLYNANSCNSCHIEDGRGRTPFSATEQLSSVLIRISTGGDDHNGPTPDPNLGLQIRNRSILKADPDGEVYVTYGTKVVTYPDGSRDTLRVPAYDFRNLRNGHATDFFYSPRIAPQLVGMGLLEAIPEQTILTYADPNDKDGDGISGKANYVWSVEKQQSVLGRFGWKANQPDVRQQVAGAFNGDIGITTPIFPDENLSGLEATLYGSLPTGSNNPGEPELPEPYFTNTVFYTQALAVPQRRNWTDPVVKRGKSLFFEVQCSKCHIPQLQTGQFTDVPLLSDQTIHPYTDLLLHDMGPDLADGRTDYLATESEWRTPPLWGIGLVNSINNNNGMFLLHDGRARTIEEAILWHGGEAEKSKEAFMKLSRTDINALIKFINDL